MYRLVLGQVSACRNGYHRKKINLKFPFNTLYFSVVKPTRCTNVSNLFYFLNDTLHVSDGLSVHHQEFKTVRTATDTCQIDTAVCLLASRQQLVLP